MPSSVPWSWSALLPPTSSLTSFSSSEPAAEWGGSDEWCQNLFDFWQLYECFKSADVFYFPGSCSRCFRLSSLAAPLSSPSLYSAPTFSSRYCLGNMKPCYWQCLPPPQGQFLFSLLSFSAPTFLVLVAMSVWLTVLAAYWALAAKVNYKNRYFNGNWRSADYKKEQNAFYINWSRIPTVLGIWFFPGN